MLNKQDLTQYVAKKHDKLLISGEQCYALRIFVSCFELPGFSSAVYCIAKRKRWIRCEMWQDFYSQMSSLFHKELRQMSHKFPLTASLVQPANKLLQTINPVYELPLWWHDSSLKRHSNQAPCARSLQRRKLLKAKCEVFGSNFTCLLSQQKESSKDS